VYADTTYVPIRYFANMLGINNVGWDGDIPLVWVNSNKPVVKKPSKKELGTHIVGTLWVDQVRGPSTSLTTFPSLKLYFNGQEDTNGSNGLFFNGSRDVPKSLVYEGSTYVPLRYFATQMGIPNEKVGYDAKAQQLWINQDGKPIRNPIVTIEMDNGGQIAVELYPDKAPNTVANFISLINQQYYDGLIFHRVIPGFMIQGGDPKGNGTGGPGYSIKGEFTGNQFNNDLSHERGVISMARAQDPNSAGSQFFIMAENASSLDGQYAAFGKVVSGMDIVDQIVGSRRDKMDKPMNNQTIRAMTVDTFGQDYGEPVKMQ
jgi:peptidyl-prolyl cis-trans isomerase B (cyclophilin B)